MKIILMTIIHIKSNMYIIKNKLLEYQFLFPEYIIDENKLMKLLKILINLKHINVQHIQVHFVLKNHDNFQYIKCYVLTTNKHQAK